MNAYLQQLNSSISALYSSNQIDHSNSTDGKNTNQNGRSEEGLSQLIIAERNERGSEVSNLLSLHAGENEDDDELTASPLVPLAIRWGECVKNSVFLADRERRAFEFRQQKEEESLSGGQSGGAAALIDRHLANAVVGILKAGGEFPRKLFDLERTDALSIGKKASEMETSLAKLQQKQLTEMDSIF
jgi:hypothetical protein